METNQDYSVITTNITEDYEVFKLELSNNGEETLMVQETEQNIEIDKQDREAEVFESKYTETDGKLQSQEEKCEEDNTVKNNDFLDHTKFLLDTCNSKTLKQPVIKQKHACPHCPYEAKKKEHLKIHIQSVHDGIKYPCPHCDYRATTKGSLKRHIQRKHVSI